MPLCSKCGESLANPLAKRRHEACCDGLRKLPKQPAAATCNWAKRQQAPKPPPKPAAPAITPARAPAVPDSVMAALKARDDAKAKERAEAERRAAAAAKQRAKQQKAEARAELKQREAAALLEEARAEAKAKQDGVPYRRPVRAEPEEPEEPELVARLEDSGGEPVERHDYCSEFEAKEKLAAAMLAADDRADERAALEQPAARAERVEQPVVEAAPGWAEEAMALQLEKPVETAEEQQQRELREQMEQVTSLETKPGADWAEDPEMDLQMVELRSNAQRKISQHQLAEEHVRYVDGEGEVAALEPAKESMRTHGANSYYCSSMPVEMGAVPQECKDEWEKGLAHVPIKNYQWYDGSTYELAAKTVR